MSAQNGLMSSVLDALQVGPGTAGEIAAELRVPRSRVADTLSRLHRTGRLVHLSTIATTGTGGGAAAKVYALPEHAPAAAGRQENAACPST